MSTHQSIMDTAYDYWKENPNMSYKDFVGDLDYKQRLAVLTGNLNYQVCNGGFMQWHDNGYSSHADQLLTLLSMHKKEPIVAEVYQLVNDALNTIKSHESQIDSHDYYHDDEDEGEGEEEYWKILSDQLAKYDDKFYEINENFMDQMERILSKIG